MLERSAVERNAHPMSIALVFAPLLTAYATIGESMAMLQITPHSAWLVLKHEGIVRDDHAIGAIQGPSGVFLPWLFGTNSEPNGRRPRSGGGLRAKCRGIIAGSLGN